MHLSLIATLPLLSALHTLAAAAQRSTDANGCSTFEPTAAYQIYSAIPDLSIDLTNPSYTDSTNPSYTDSTNPAYTDSTNPAYTNSTNGTTTNSTRLATERLHPSKFRRSAHVPFTFLVSQDANNTDIQDLVVAFSGLPCSGPGPFSFEFNFQPQSAYFTEGQGQINMFRVNTLDLGTNPTYNSIEPLTGSLVGTFELPKVGADEPKLLYLNQLVCQDQLVLRFGISRYSSQEGSVAYMNSGGMGLRERSGC